ncbi:hydroxysqualene dehydroxylase HpnE [Paludibaculum fermentans]|uniref:hydroxysqualene dehydroxylase HpnE n=1 Tax=Paludibaculum fermentans TaxID=1473598 RepID=UPI003EB70D4A
MPNVLVLGGGLAGLSSAAALGQSGHHVTVLEARHFLGGRATSYPLPADESGEVIDNCQHILLRCCVNLLDFYKRLGVDQCIQFHKEFFFIEPGGRTSTMKAGILPKPLHFTGSFATLHFLSLADKLAVGRAMLAIQSEWHSRKDLDTITMLDWLKEKHQPARAIERFWRQVLVSSINEELDRMAASHGLQVFYLGFLASSSSYQMGVPAVPLGELYALDAWKRIPGVDIRFRTPVTRIEFEAGKVKAAYSGDERFTADYYISALPFERLALLATPLNIDFSPFEHSPITGIHLWFDRPVTGLPHATLLDRTIQWAFNKQDGRYIQLVVSASRTLTDLPRNEVIDLAVRELKEFFPDAQNAQLVKAHVVKEVRATFSARPGLEQLRPEARTHIPNLVLAGDWTRSGWPATMEGAVRSGYKAADVVYPAGSYLLPDIA